MPRLNTTNTKKKKTVTDHSAGWPADGAIDLTVQDLPHSSSATEWWYQNCHLATINGRHFSLFASFGRTATGRNRITGETNYTWSLSWVLSDSDNNKYYADSLKERTAPIGNTDKLHLTIADNSFQKIQEGKYQLKLHNPQNGIICELNCMPFVNPIRHGNNGVITGTGSTALFHYFIPACEVNGSITIAGENTHEVEGCGWYDHEFGKTKKTSTTYNWLSLQLDNSWQITVYDQPGGRYAILIDPDGNAASINDFQFVPNESYTTWRLVIAEFYIDLDVHATHPDQEFVTPAFREGRVQAKGKFGKRIVNGLGFIECSGTNAD